MKRERETWVDVAKGFGIIFVVLGHVVSSYHNSGLLEDAEAFSFVHAFVESFHMPLFFILSGYVAGRSPDRPQKWRQVGRKILCLGIPYVVFSILNWGMKFALSSLSNSTVSLRDLLMIPLFPINHMWYLYTLCLLAVIHILMKKPLSNKWVALGAILLAFLLRKVFYQSGWLYEHGLSGSVIGKTVNRAMWYFLGNAIACLFRPKTWSSLWSIPAGVGTLLFAVLYWVCKRNDWVYPPMDLVLAALGCTVFILLSVGLHRCKFLSYLGRNSLPIYLLHGLVLSATRIVLSKLGVPLLGGAVPLVLCSVLGIGISLLCYLVCRKVPPLDFFFYPGQYIKKNV